MTLPDAIVFDRAERDAKPPAAVAEGVTSGIVQPATPAANTAPARELARRPLLLIAAPRRLSGVGPAFSDRRY